MKETDNFNLSLYEAGDKASLLDGYNKSMGLVDTALKANNDAIALKADASAIGTLTNRVNTVETKANNNAAQITTVKSDVANNTKAIETTNGKVTANTSAIADINNKLNIISPLDIKPTAKSTKGVTSGGVYDAMQAAVKNTSKRIVIIGDSWVMTNPSDTTKPYYSHWVTLMKNRYPDSIFFTRYDAATPTKIADTKNEIDILAADDTFANDSVTDVLMVAGLNGGTAADTVSVASYARSKFNANLTFTWAQDCYTPLQAIYGGNIVNVDATAYINASNSAVNNKYIDLSSFLISPHFFSNDGNNNAIKGAKIIGFHPSKVGSYRMFSYFANYFFGEHLGAWGKQPFNASNFNSCFKFGSSTGQAYENNAVSVSSTYVDYETGSFKIGFYNESNFTNLDVCNFPPVNNNTIPNLELPLNPKAIVQGVSHSGGFYKQYGNMYLGNASSSGLTLMEGSLASTASYSTKAIYLSI